MLSRSAAFDTAIRNGGRVVVSCAIQRFGITIAQIDLMPGASIHFDQTSPQRSTFKGQVPNTAGMAPHLPTDTLAPFTIEAVVSTGMVTPAAPAGEMLQLGIFLVQVVKDDTTGLINISGADRSVKVAAALNESPYTIAAGTPLDSAIAGYLAAKYPSMVLLADGAAHSLTLASTVVYQPGTASGDPWANMRTLAADFGRELFINNLGQAVLQPVPDPTVQPVVWSYQPGVSNLAISGDHTMDTSQGIANVAVVSSGGTGSGTPITESTEITDPTSPIYPDPNGFGRRPVFLSSAQIANQAQAFATGRSLLNRQPGLFDQVSFTAVPHPAHTPGDVVVYGSNLLGFQMPIVLVSWDLQVDLQAPVDYTTQTAGAVQETVLADALNAGLV